MTLRNFFKSVIGLVALPHVFRLKEPVPLKRISLTNCAQIFPGLTVKDKSQGLSIVIEYQPGDWFEHDGQLISNCLRNKWYARDESEKRRLYCFYAADFSDLEFYI